ncbi:thermonuclease family protein [Nocardioides sp. B-3]|uniref:thermonuclease family protein n=1 Tax=Nocardioides sp. B-3 TaxID=2895565 RepID=UPI002152DDEC|nr:thermonuclease family protein [Nocardioides sp. B-3]UUZ58593.1 thermonuclease family protein [Nocardioides sp. B-3]
MRRFLSPLALIAPPAATLSWVAPASAAVDMDCGDFATRAAAQSFFLSAGPGDPHRLDADGDGVVCESNPCPCAGSQPVPLVTQTSPPAPTTTPAPTGTDPNGSGNSGPVRRHAGNVVKVTDGDTLKVRIDGVGVRSVRILGIDTPELYGGRECGGDAASAHMERPAPVGSRVRLESDPSRADRDRYGRWLRYVSRKGLDVGREQIRRGPAVTYVYRNDPFRRTRAYQRTEKVAHNMLRGSWDLCW